MDGTVPIKTIGAVAFLLLAGISGCTGAHVIDTGHRGVKVTYGKVEESVLGEGLYFVNPFTSSIHEVNVQTQRQELQMGAYTKDVQAADVTLVVNYNLNKDKAPEMLRDVGEDWEEKLIPQSVQGSVKTIIGKWDAVDLVSNRDKAQAAILQELIDTLAVKDVTVSNVEITGLSFKKEFEDAVEAKVRAIQEADQAKNETVRVQETANQKVISAKAEAESMRIRAQALESNPKLTEWAAVEKWDGHLPTYMLGGATPFINVSSAGK